MCGAKSVYMSFMDDESKKEMLIVDVLKELNEKLDDNKEIILSLIAEAETEELPNLRLI